MRAPTTAKQAEPWRRRARRAVLNGQEAAFAAIPALAASSDSSRTVTLAEGRDLTLDFVLGP